MGYEGNIHWKYNISKVPVSLMIFVDQQCY